MPRRTHGGSDDAPRGWDALVAWGAGRVLRRLGSGRDRDVRLVELGGRRAVARLGGAGDEALDWEIDLLGHLHEVGVGVPRIVPALDGRRRVGQLIVVEEVDGRPPESTEDWRAVVSALQWLHRMTEDWTQRPGRRSSIEMVRSEHSDDLDLSRLPVEVVETCRAAWQRLADAPLAVVQGDPSGSNIRITATGPVFLDWSASRVDVADLDLVGLPNDVLPISGKRLWRAAQAEAAWAAARDWVVDEALARRHLERIDWP